MPQWMEPIRKAMEKRQGGGGYLLLMPEYRPELVQAIASRFGLAYRDFRRECMAPRGARAARLPLAELDGFLERAGAAQGLVVQNAEALLAVKSGGERRAWLARFVRGERPHPVLLPLVLFASDAPDEEDRVIRLDASALPQSTLLMRLASMR